jgi:hypothetical protein
MSNLGAPGAALSIFATREADLVSTLADRAKIAKGLAMRTRKSRATAARICTKTDEKGVASTE